MDGVLSLRVLAARALRFALLCLVLRRPTLVFISAILTDSWLSSELRRDSTETCRRLILICESCEFRRSGVELREWWVCVGRTRASRRRTKRGRVAAQDEDNSQLEKRFDLSWRQSRRLFFINIQRSLIYLYVPFMFGIIWIIGRRRRVDTKSDGILSRSSQRNREATTCRKLAATSIGASYQLVFASATGHFRLNWTPTFPGQINIYLLTYFVIQRSS